ncbi:MAG: alpha/beta fold hydrolase, partial [Alphaproteobacteria bacterium]|nr:alpha/beta fold hydrolase [Alphaproteobacteria bacterium]
IAQCQIANVSQNETLDAMAATVLAGAPDRFALAGLSMGGYVCHAIMRRAPERVEKLALLDTSARADTEEQSERRRQLIAMSEVDKFRGVTDRLLPLLIASYRLDDVDLTQRIKEMAERVGEDAFYRHQRAIMARPDSRDQLAGYDLATLVACGRDDTLTPVELHEEMAASIPGARLALIEECGHLSTMEQPQAVTALLRQWLLHD